MLTAATDPHALRVLSAARIMDYIEQGKLSVAGVKFFVLDEADRLLDTGNQVRGFVISCLTYGDVALQCCKARSEASAEPKDSVTRLDDWGIMYPMWWQYHGCKCDPELDAMFMGAPRQPCMPKWRGTRGCSAHDQTRHCQ